MQSDFYTFLNRFASFTEAELAEINKCFHPLKLKKGKPFLRQGQHCRHVVFIVKGVLRIFYMKEGKPVTRYLGMEPSFITSLSSFISQTPAHENIEAIEDSELLLISYEDMLRLCKVQHAWETLYRKVLEHMFMCVEDRIREFITLTAEERYATILRDRPRLIQRVPQKYIASYIGVAPQSLSRLQKSIYDHDKLTNVNNLM